MKLPSVLVPVVVVVVIVVAPLESIVPPTNAPLVGGGGDPAPERSVGMRRSSSASSRRGRLERIETPVVRKDPRCEPDTHSLEAGSRNGHPFYRGCLGGVTSLWRTSLICYQSRSSASTGKWPQMKKNVQESEFERKTMRIRQRRARAGPRAWSGRAFIAFDLGHTPRAMLPGCMQCMQCMQRIATVNPPRRDCHRSHRHRRPATVGGATER